MGSSSPELSKIADGCAYCGRARPLALLEPCCERPEHSARLVCADAHECLGVVLALLHEQEQREAEWLASAAPRSATTSAPSGASTTVTVDAISDQRDATTSAERQARLTAARAVLADYVRWTSGEILQAGGAYDWQGWADRLAQHLGYVLDVVSP
jgi:hypothetical protein